MSIYRGAGGASDATDDSTVNAVAGYASAAASSASSAATSATNASNSATAAASSASSAASSASSVATNASNAASSAGLANTYATTASASKDAAAASAATASTKAGEASTSASNAATSASTASTQATNAASSASAAATSASAASTSASNAASSAASALAIYANTTAMNTAVAAAATSATNADTSADAAYDAQILAEAAVTGASLYADAAQASANNAQANATSAASAASAANISATSAASSAASATTSATNAAASATSAAAITGSGNGTFVNTPITTNSTITLSEGRANGVAYLNGSKVLTTGSSLTFDGSNLSAFGSFTSGTTGVAGSYVLARSSDGSGTTVLESLAGTNNIGLRNTVGSLLFSANNAEGMRLTSTGLGIGTTSPAATLDVRGAATSTLYIGRTANSGVGSQPGSISFAGPNASGTAFIWNGVRSVIANATAGSEAASLIFSNRVAGAYPDVMTLGSSGNLGLGVTPSAWGTGYKAMDIGSVGAITSTSTTLRILGNAYATDSNYAYKTTAAATMYTQGSGQHQWFNAASGTAGANISFTQAMTLDSSGRLLLGTTSFTYSDSNSVMLNNTAGNGYFQHLTGTASGQTYVEFIYAATKIGSISQSGTTAVLYNVTSDQRLKENIQNADSASSLIDALQVRKFDWKADGSHQRYGFVAQELVTVVPEAVHQPADTEDMMAVDYSKLVPMLVKEIQTLRARVAQLESTH